MTNKNPNLSVTKRFNIPLWQNLNLRWKLTLILSAAALIPVLIITEVNLQFARTTYLDNLKINLKEKGRLFTTDFVLWGLDEAKTEAQTIAKSIQDTGVDLGDPKQLAKNQLSLQSLLQVSAKDVAPESIKNFKLITDNNGKTLAQVGQTIDEDFSTAAKLIPLGQVSSPNYRTIPLNAGISLADVEIVKLSLSTGESKTGTELLKDPTLQALGLANQAAIATRPQVTQGLKPGKAPFPEGTFDIEQGRIGIANMAVTPIKVNGRVVGAVVVGELLNRNHGIVEGFQKKLNIPVATIFAQDYRVATSVPYLDPATKKTDGTRAIGTRVSQEVAETVLNKRQNFVGETNIVGLNYLTYYEPLYNHQDQAIGISFIGISLQDLQNNLNTLLIQSYGLGFGTVSLLALLAWLTAGFFVKPLVQLSNFSQQISEGKIGLGLEETNNKDEIGFLTQEMNKMAISIQSNFKSSKLQLEIAARAREVRDIQAIFDLTVLGAKDILGADRVVVYQFNPNGSGFIVAEAVDAGLPIALNDKIEDACISENLIEAYKQGRVVPTKDVFNAGFHPDHLELMKRLTIRANLVTPIVTENQLFGLLIAHFCYETHEWKEAEISVLRQLGLQLGLGIERVNFIEKQQVEALRQKQEKEILQRRALELLIEVEPISRGDLTVRAEVTEDEIGTVADSYNSTVENLRRIVTQVQTASKQMLDTTSSSESSIQDLSAEALRQAEEISVVLDRLQEMSGSIHTVALNANEAEIAVQQANKTLTEGDIAMIQTVDGILAISHTVTETAEKVKRLGEASQNISRVVNLISSFAEQTNLLALNAAIEAARAGEQGRGFAVVADEVQVLAQQSAEASAEIADLVAEIQAGTSEVVMAMETGTKQVNTGTRLVEDTRKNLTKIAEASVQIGTLVESIAKAASVQLMATNQVTEAMTDVAEIAFNTSTGANQASNSFKDLLEVAQQLQKSVGQFKVS